MSLISVAVFVFLTSPTLIREVVDGLRIYFDFTLPTLLLYNFERDQYRTAMQIPLDDSCSLSELPSTPVPELGTEVTDEERNGFVSSSTETVSSTSKATTTTAKPHSESNENTEESKFSLICFFFFQFKNCLIPKHFECVLQKKTA